MAGLWHLWIDTGGTFTDCISSDPKGNTSRLKVLSSSKLRCRILRINYNRIKVEHNWPVTRDIFLGYTFKILKSELAGRIISFDVETSSFITEEAIPDFQEGDMEICSDEEVPIFAARILTQTLRDELLPLIDLRLGSTRGTNALLERKGAATTLIITKGFKDLLLIGNQQRSQLFSLVIEKPIPYYSNVIEVNERLDAFGNIEIDLTDEEIAKVSDQLDTIHPGSIAIAFLHAYKNPLHENKLKEELLEKGYYFISTSSELSPSIKIVPRAETVVANAYLDPIIKSYVWEIKQTFSNSRFLIMTSAGGLSRADLFYPKDSLLSGPAGGLVGASKLAGKSGFDKIISFDMGGTSTDVSRFDKGYDYSYITTVGGISIVSPALAIETIAAGGGSVCTFDGFKLTVGPESAGADPGPACYGSGGPLTLTDVNVLLGKIDPDRFGIPINISASKDALDDVIHVIQSYGNSLSKEEVLVGFEQIANEKMAEAIKKISTSKGFDPSEYALVAFGGAGGQHACKIADLLSIKTILIPQDAGLLSAYGIGVAEIERVEELQVLRLYSEINLNILLKPLEEKVKNKLIEEGFDEMDILIHHKFVYLRFKGQEHTIELDICHVDDIEASFENKYRKMFGHWISSGVLELESVKIIGKGLSQEKEKSNQEGVSYQPKNIGRVESFNQGGEGIPLYEGGELKPGAKIKGPAVLGSLTNTTFIEPDWQLDFDGDNAILKRISEGEGAEQSEVEYAEEAQISLFSNRFTAIAHEMGSLLQRTSFSVNIRERLDFSCAILDAEGYLIVNAPHIPVHLGSLGMCVRSLVRSIDMREGDVIITNHPRFGGSHLPDITLVAPVFVQGNLIAFIANRAHHAEIGGTRPGSMPPNATSLEEEGVVIMPTHLVKEQKVLWNEVESIFTKARYPTRALEENLADLNGALAAINYGVAEMTRLVEKYSVDIVEKYMLAIKQDAAISIKNALKIFSGQKLSAKEVLDGGEKIVVGIQVSDEGITIDFTGTSLQSETNFNATPAITTSAILYVLRLLCSKPIPLNEGIMELVNLVLPKCLLNPDFSGRPSDCPPVVGGNTETSQRLVDTLLKAFGIAACSQGTMNNVLFGDKSFGYYETICGGVGATEGYKGASGVHQHMTNTRITDPEVLELRYPVKLEEFSIRDNSGGKGKWYGGNGVIRRMRFKAPASLTILSQHRKVAPYGIHGGKDGKVGEQWVEKKDGTIVELTGIDTYEIERGDTFVIQTPGGGGFGK